MTSREKAFIEEYVKDENGTQAAIRAGYSPNGARVRAHKLLTKDNIRAEIDTKIAQREEETRRLEEERRERLRVDEDRVLDELAKIAFCDTDKLIDPETGLLREGYTREDAAAIAGIQIETKNTLFGEQRTAKYTRYDKLAALKLIMQATGMLDGGIQTGKEDIPCIVDDLSDTG